MRQYTSVLGVTGRGSDSDERERSDCWPRGWAVRDGALSVVQRERLVDYGPLG